MFDKKILKLTLTKQWFDLIKSGRKVFEYREYKQHWKSRLLNGVQFKEFDEVHFTNGYGKHRPFMRVKCENIIVFTAKKNGANNEPLAIGIRYFMIGLGEVLETRNLTA